MIINHLKSEVVFSCKEKIDSPNGTYTPKSDENLKEGGSISEDIILQCFGICN